MGWWDDIFDEIKTASSPSLETFSDLPADLDDWSCSNWQLYITRNEAIYGIAKAREYFYVDFDRLHQFASAWDCKYDCDFIRFLNSKGIDYSSILSNVYCTAENLTGVAEKWTRTSKIWIPILLGSAVIAWTAREDIKKLFK